MPVSWTTSALSSRTRISARRVDTTQSGSNEALRTSARDIPRTSVSRYPGSWWYSHRSQRLTRQRMHALAPMEVTDHVGRLRCMGGIAVLGLHPEPHVVGGGIRQVRPAPPPAGRGQGEQLRQRRRPEIGPPHHRPHRAAPIPEMYRSTRYAAVLCTSRHWPAGQRLLSSFHGPASARGSLGRPRTISPMMLRWIWLVPA